MNSTVRLKVFAEERRRSGRPRHAKSRRSAAIVWALGCCLAGNLAADPPPNTLPATRQFETPQQTDGLKLEEIRQVARENAERYRLRITLPTAAFEGPTFDGGNTPTEGKPTSSAAGIYGPADLLRALPKFAWIFPGILAWVLLARKLAPEVLDYLTGWLRSKMPLPPVSTKQLVTLLAEEKAVAEFQAALHSGSGAGEEMEAPVSPASLSGQVGEIIRLLQEAACGVGGASQRDCLVETIDRIAPLQETARTRELLPLRQMAAALELLLKQMAEKSGNITSSTLRTANVAATLLEELCHADIKADLLTQPPPRLLAVDDELFSRYALVHSLKRGFYEPEVAEHGEAALKLAGQHNYDLIVLDVQMPGMDGFELCSRIHEAPSNRTTPVIFVTSLRDFDARANSLLCGGRDLIAKPFLTFELTVKALTLVVGERLRGRGRLAETQRESASSVETAAPPGDRGACPGNAMPSAADDPGLPTNIAVPVDNGGAPRLQTTSEFFSLNRSQVKKARKFVKRVENSPDARVRRELLGRLFVRIHSLALGAESSRHHTIALAYSALEALLKKMLQDDSHCTPNMFHTLATAIALIQDLCLGEVSAELALAPPIRILAVDDDPISLRAISNALQRTFPKPETASGGKAAVALATKHPFDVIFLDVQMPDLDGFEVCAKVRASVANRSTPVIFVTNHEAAELQARCAAVGGTEFVAKPCVPAELNLKAITFALRSRLPKQSQTQESAQENDPRVPVIRISPHFP